MCTHVCRCGDQRRLRSFQSRARRCAGPCLYTCHMSIRMSMHMPIRIDVYTHVYAHACTYGYTHAHGLCICLYACLPSCLYTRSKESEVPWGMPVNMRTRRSIPSIFAHPCAHMPVHMLVHFPAHMPIHMYGAHVCTHAAWVPSPPYVSSTSAPYRPYRLHVGHISAPYSCFGSILTYYRLHVGSIYRLYIGSISHVLYRLIMTGSLNIAPISVYTSHALSLN